MPRILALDPGSKTIGTALSDETFTLASPGRTILRQPEGYRKDMAAVRDLAEANEVCEVIVGLPLMMDGSRGEQAIRAEEFAEQLRRFVTVPVVMQDERLTTAGAARALHEADMTHSRRKKVVDSVAACLLLQTYLEVRRRPGAP